MIGRTGRDFCAFSEQRYGLPMIQSDSDLKLSEASTGGAQTALLVMQAARNSTPAIEPERSVFGKYQRVDVSACEIRSFKYENTSPKHVGEVSDFVSPPQAISSQDQRLRCAHRVISAPIRLHVICDAETAERQKRVGSVVLLRTF